LGAVLKRLPQDWEKRYAVRPALAETFVDTKRFKVRVIAPQLESGGENGGPPDGKPKAILIYPLTRQWRKKLCAEIPTATMG